MPILQIIDIKKHYLVKNRVKEVLKGISLDLFSGEVVSLLGLNGSGKTTLLSILVTLLAPSSGQIFWKGASIYKKLFSYRGSVGFSPQKPNLDPILTLEQNLLFAGRYFNLNKQRIQDRKEKLIKQFELESVMHLPLHLLSIGYKQRFLLARTLIHDPSIIILDEPTVGLDPCIRNQIQKVILSLKEEGKTIILATHYLEEAEALSDRIIVINNGVIKQIDTPKKIREGANLEKLFLHLIKPMPIFP
ncbi:ABC transporter ATP-binding protein [Candidatus Rhabdochlamydia porcellionis]|uniref:ABC transporter ATP-binding protein NatA n=1 Tax=Candidatus Rhabdochlamydia porcellionis TaxID=225148 RepID=A0ABX8Z4X6_9BACT|nr:ABC transporter ATP-binding protein [Candidatus Rhabdochlamydia porcellionis]QZA59358.1 ABC transporter ATP-binding protein NatA [Candidatus Rhabdochlamydia porcellionis]